MDLLKRSLAPITDRGWSLIEEEAVRTLKAHLSARKIVDVDGPKGIDLSAVNLGRLDIPEKQSNEGLSYGLRRVLPLVELRVRFELDVWELDNSERGARDPDLDPVIEAAKRLSKFEDEAVYHGFEAGSIVGLRDSSSHDPIAMGKDAKTYPEVVARAILALNSVNVEGPYALALGPEAYRGLAAQCMGYPVSRQVESLIEGPVVYAPFIQGGFLLSLRGGDLELTLGQDASIGYETHTPSKVRLYLSESFTFRILNSDAFVKLTT